MKVKGINFFKKTPWVRFVNLIPGVELVHPIIPAQQYRYRWMNEAAKYFKHKENTQPPNTSISGVVRCPGIVNYLKQGYIVTAPFDFTIITKEGNRETFFWEVPNEFGNASPIVCITSHGKEELGQFMPYRNDSLECAVKINTMWVVNSSSDIVLLQLPIAYPDHNMFTAFSGFIDCDEYTQVNVQLQWHVLDGIQVVKAGTPLCQLIPIPKKFAVELAVERITDEDRYVLESYRYLKTHSYKKVISLWKTAAKKILNRS